jgi:hypothetical protein
MVMHLDYEEIPSIRWGGVGNIVRALLLQGRGQGNRVLGSQWV